MLASAGFGIWAGFCCEKWITFTAEKVPLIPGGQGMPCGGIVEPSFLPQSPKGVTARVLANVCDFSDNQWFQ